MEQDENYRQTGQLRQVFKLSMNDARAETKKAGDRSPALQDPQVADS
jgi:hypothetical protein